MPSTPPTTLTTEPQASTAIAPSSLVSATSYMPATPSVNDADLQKAKTVIDNIAASYRSKVVGQDALFLSLMVAMMTNGHILLESVPGLAKTTAARTLAGAIKASFHRIQCTPDVLPSDIIGTQIYNYATAKFETQLGPVHANFVLLDEINRSSAKTQSAMLEAMQERQTTIGGSVYKLPQPFIVLATQNPIEQEGTYELPEAQMDRFLLKEILTYPKPEEEVEMLNRIESGVLGNENKTSGVVELADILYIQGLVNKVYADKIVKDYIVKLVSATRNPAKFISADLARYVEYGVSPRGSISLLQVAKAIALMSGRGYVTPDDVKQLRYSVLRHRIILNFEAIADSIHQEAIIDAIFATITTP